MSNKSANDREYFALIDTLFEVSSHCSTWNNAMLRIGHCSFMKAINYFLSGHLLYNVIVPRRTIKQDNA